MSDEDRDSLEEYLEDLPEKRVFTRFQDLPTELRLMVWKAVANPPSSRNYFDTISLDAEHGRTDPSAVLTEDYGLWKACRESRQVMDGEYGKAFEACYNHQSRQFILANKGHWIIHECYNTHSLALQKELRSKVWALRVDVQQIDQLLRRLVSCVPHSELTDALGKWFPQAFGPGGMPTDELIPVDSLARICLGLDRIITPWEPEVGFWQKETEPGNRNHSQ